MTFLWLVTKSSCRGINKLFYFFKWCFS